MRVVAALHITLVLADAKTRCRWCDWAVIASCVRIRGTCDVVGLGVDQMCWVTVGERLYSTGLGLRVGHITPSANINATPGSRDSVVRLNFTFNCTTSIESVG